MASKEDIEKLRQLNPEDRIVELKKKLVKLEEERKKEVEEATKLIKDSEGEIQEKEEVIRKIPIPQMTSVDINSLFSPAEKEMFKNLRYSEDKKPENESENAKKKKKEENLEDSLSGIALPHATGTSAAAEFAHHHMDYAAQLSLRPAEDLYKMATEIYQHAAEQGYINQQEQERSRDLMEAIYKKQGAIYDNKYKPDSQEIAEKLDVAKKILGYSNRV